MLFKKSPEREAWWKDAVFYALDVKRYRDSNGDGMGDLQGVIEKLDYIADLGATCLWLSPFYESPNLDNGYDVAEYLQIDKRLGTYEDFDTLVQQAKKRGIRIVIDLVGDHTSSRHPWFEASRRDPDSRFRKYYYWSDKPLPVSEENGPALKEEVETVWEYDARAGAYYYHRYYAAEPSLNLNDDEVREELKRAICFWMSFDIAGYRLDAAMNMIKTPVPAYERFKDPHDILREIYAQISSRGDNAVVLGEVSVPVGELPPFMDGKQFNMLFNFLLNAKTFLALATKEAAPVYEALESLPKGTSRCSWANFLRHFDELNLSLLQEDEKKIVLDTFAPDENMRVFRDGIRRRTAPMLGSLARLKMAYTLMFACPGTPVIIYGDEIGMGEDLSQNNRDSVRAPMQWSGAANGGFSDGVEKNLIQRMVDDAAFGYAAVNAEGQTCDDSSMLAHMKRLTALRKKLPLIRAENLSMMRTLSACVVALDYEGDGRRLIALHNLSDEQVTLAIESDGPMTDLFEKAACSHYAGTLKITLPAYGFVWLSDKT